MIRTLRFGLLALLLAGLVLPLATLRVRADDKEETNKAMKAAKEAVEALIKSGGKGAEALAKKNDIVPVMYLFKPRNERYPNAIGYGAKGEAVEIKIMNLAKKTLPAAQLQKESADLITMAKQTKAIGELNKYYAPKTKKAGKDPKDWHKYNDEMQKYADDLIEAVKSGKPDAVKKVSNALNSACVNCHGIFRDS